MEIRDFTAQKQSLLFQKLKQDQFNGQVLVRDITGVESIFYLYLGRILFVTGGINPVRRFRRNLAAYIPEITADNLSLLEDFQKFGESEFELCWEYYLLCLWNKQKKVSRSQMISMIRGILVDVLFDLTLARYVKYETKQDSSILSSTPLVLLDAEEAIAFSWKLCSAWQRFRGTYPSPNYAPLLKNPKELQNRTDPQTYEVLRKILDGKRSLFDLTVQMKRDVVRVTRLLMPYIEVGLVELVEIPDLQAPITLPNLNISAPNQSTQELIACVDDSPSICLQMEKIITAAGYQFIGINDPLRAIPVMLNRKPQFIFLDLVMPNANGYEICTQLRKLDPFRHTPIVILTGNDGIIDRVRAKMVGSSDFLAKPVNELKVKTAIALHLPKKPATY